MPRLLTTITTTDYTKDLEIPLNDSQDIYYLTGQAQQPISYDVDKLLCSYGYIRRHREDYVLYVGQTIDLNNKQMTFGVHLLQDGDCLTINSCCQMVFRIDL